MTRASPQLYTLLSECGRTTRVAFFVGKTHTHIYIYMCPKQSALCWQLSLSCHYCSLSVVRGLVFEILTHFALRILAVYGSLWQSAESGVFAVFAKCFRFLRLPNLPTPLSNPCGALESSRWQTCHCLTSSKSFISTGGARAHGRRLSLWSVSLKQIVESKTRGGSSRSSDSYV